MTAVMGADIRRLIPQREPMIMIDTFYGATESEADTGFTVPRGNLFDDDGCFAEPGLVEHIAQSASAFAGYRARAANRPAPTGFIGEVGKCRIHFLPRAGDRLRTHIRILSEVFGVSLLTAETKVNGEVAVCCRMKIFIREGL
jgi:predicted hotdog family 3-hydroxylacyl-ACP dehydratase